MCTGSLSSSPAQEPGNEASVAYDSGIQFKPYCRVMVSVRYIQRVLKSKLLSLWQQWLVSSRSGRSMNFREKDYITHVSPCLPGMDKWANNFCKWRAECFHRFLIIVWTEHCRWQASFTPEKSTDKLRLVQQGRRYRSFQVPQKNLGNRACANSVYQALPPILFH